MIPRSLIECWTDSSIFERVYVRQQLCNSLASHTFIVVRRRVRPPAQFLAHTQQATHTCPQPPRSRLLLGGVRFEVPSPGVAVNLDAQTPHQTVSPPRGPSNPPSHTTVGLPIRRGHAGGCGLALVGPPHLLRNAHRAGVSRIHHCPFCTAHNPTKRKTTTRRWYGDFQIVTTCSPTYTTCKYTVCAVREHLR